MKTSSTLILAILTIIALVYIQFFSGKISGTAERENRDRKLLVIEASEVNRIELMTGEGSFVFSKNNGAGWQIESPVSYPANSNEIDSLLSEIEFQERRSTLDKKQMGDMSKTQEQFGLKQPRIRLVIRTGKEVCRLDIGAETVRKGTCYGRVNQGGKERYIILDQSLESHLLKKLDQWRSPKIFDFTSGDITGLTLHQDVREVSVEKDANRWKILKPLTTMADPTLVSSFLGNLLALQAEKFLSDNPANNALYGLNSPFLVFDVRLGTETRTLRVGRVESGGETSYYGQLTSRAAVFGMSKATVDMLSSLLEKVRDCRIAGEVANQDITALIFEREKFSIEMKRQSDGGSGWMLSSDGDVPLDDGIVSDLLQRIHNARALTFLPASDDNRKKLDLLKPYAKVTLQLRQADPKAAPQKYVLAFSRGKKGECSVESGFRDDLVTVTADVLTGIPDTLEGWMDRNISFVRGKEITGLEWRRGAEVFSVARETGKDWPVEIQGQKIDPLFLKGQLRLLAGCKIQGWIPVTDTDLPQQNVVLTVSTGTDRKVVEISANAAANQYVGRIAGASHAFLMNKSDYLALTSLPLQKTAGTPAAEATVPPSAPGK